MTPARLTYTVEEAAEALGIGRTTAWGMVRLGRLPVLRVGRRVLIARQELEEWVSREALQ